MRKRNQYTEDVEEYKITHGVDPFIRYKEEDCSEEEKQELEEWLFQCCRRRNVIPHTILTEQEMDRDIINLSETDSHSVYNGKEYTFNNNGVRTCRYFFSEEMYNVTKSGHRSVRTNFEDDYHLRTVIKKSLMYGSNELSINNWLILKGSGYGVTFRPASAKAIYELFGKKEGCRVFDSSAGYGARMLGAHVAENVYFYLGIDPNTAPSCERLIKVLDERYDTNTEKKVLKMGSEDFTPEAFPEYVGTFDLYFTSPPYYNTEQYSTDPSQSYLKFPTYAEWMKGFYRTTIYNACDMLKKDGIFIINIFEKTLNVKELTKLFCADKGWYLVKEDEYLLKTIPGNYHKLDEDGNPVLADVTRHSYEPVWYLKHWSRLLEEGLITEQQAKEYEDRELK